MREIWTISTPKYESDIINSNLRVSPWEGHRNFVYDLVNFMEPEEIVELGTHYGCSFFAMCQCIKDNNLKSKIYAVDTWQGDPQAGFYGEEVYETVTRTIDKYFKQVDLELKRELFDNVVNQFEDNSIDLLHIDGLHTYEAVSNDYYTWLPKLKENGIILFHDIASHLGYGTNTFWEELKSNTSYNYFEFDHSWGLGVLFPKGNINYIKLKQQNIEDKVKLYKYRALYELREIQNKDLTSMVEERDKAIKSQGEMIQERDKAIKSQDIMIQQRDEAIKSQEKMIQERDIVIESQGKMIQDRDEDIKSQEKMIQDRDEAIKSQDKMIQDRDEDIKSQEKMIQERDKAIKSQDKMIQDRDEAIKSQGRMIQERDEEIKTQTQIIQDRDNLIRTQEETIQTKESALQSEAALVKERDELIEEQRQKLEEIYSKKIVFNFKKRG